ncbi:MAG: aminotransferase class I/II-fold pyridoxal phosphate-dependent enzyme [Actinomycetes bacterium]
MSSTILSSAQRLAPGSVARWDDLDRLRRQSPLYDAVIEEIDGRRIRIGNHWLSDFGSCNYLGFDLDPEVMAAIDPAVAKWGTHPSWSRLLGSPRICVDIEDRLTDLLGAPDTLVLPTITHIHHAVIPILAGQGTIFMDAKAHKTIYDGTTIARGRGATVVRFEADNADDLAHSLRAADPRHRRLVVMDGVNSMTGNAADLATFARVCRENDALLYVDDAHGFGVIGEQPSPGHPYGLRGNSIVKLAGESYDNVVLVGGFSKAYSSLLAFLALPTSLKNLLKVAAAPYLYSGPSPTASLATVMAGLDVNESRGDAIRTDLHRKTARVLDTVHALGVHTPNTSDLPIIELPLENPDDVDAVGEFLFDRGVYVTLAAYPIVPRDEVGFRIQVTAANTDEEITQLCQVLRDLVERFPLQKAA